MKFSCKQGNFIFFLKNFRKTIDNLTQLCYNIIVGEGTFLKNSPKYLKKFDFYQKI